MKRSTKITLIVIPTILVASFVIWFLPVYILSPSFGKPRVKNIIQIYSDNDFEELNLPGSGTSNDPFIIENQVLGINASGIKNFYYGLDVANTTKYFIVRNCTFFGGLNAIRLENVSEGTVLISGNHFYARVQREWDHEIGRSGIEIKSTDKVAIRNNSFASAYKYVDLYYYLTTYNANNIVFENNTCDAGFIDIKKSSDVVFNGNIFENFFYLENLHFLNFTNNVFEGEHSFIEFGNCSYSSFRNNTFYSRINLWKSPYTIFSGNSMYSSSGLEIKGSSYVEVNNNKIVFTGEEISTYDRGIVLCRESSYCNIQSNSIYNFSYYGIYLIDDSNFNTIFHNSLFNNFITNSTSQAYDECVGNIWYNPYIFEGNYWSNLGLSSTYAIDGSAGSIDLYPLSSPLY